MRTEYYRNVALAKVFGGGVTGWAATTSVVWAARKARVVLGSAPERLATLDVRAGETLTLTARPPVSRRERKLAATEAELLKDLRRLRTPDRAQRKVERSLVAAQAKLAKAKPGSRRQLRRSAEVAKLTAELGRRRRPGRKERRLDSQLRSTRRELDTVRATVQATARAGARPPTSVTDPA